MTTAPCTVCGNVVSQGTRHCATPGCQLHTLGAYCGRHESLGEQVPATHTERLSGPGEPTLGNGASPDTNAPADDAPPGYHSWAKEMLGLLAASNDVKWELGASLTYGEDAFGETVWQAIEVTKAQESSLRNYGWVHRKVPPHVRLRDQLSFEHHKAVASLEPEDQARLLRQAADGGWPVTALRAEVRELKGREELPKVRCDRCGKEHTCVEAEE